MVKPLLIGLVAAQLAGCGLSTFTQRETDPFIRDVFFNLKEPVAIMVTDSSRRLVFEFKAQDDKKIYCVDAPPDTSIATSGAVGGDVSATIPTAAPNVNGGGTLGDYRVSTSSTVPLVRRSQGLQWERDNAARECMLYAMGLIDSTQYVQRLDKIRADAKEVIQQELATMGAIAIPTPTLNTPVAPPTPAKKN